MDTKISRDSLSAAMTAFEAKGGKVEACDEGKRNIDPAIRFCSCGCAGNWTDHTMRLGESGNRATWAN